MATEKTQEEQVQFGSVRVLKSIYDPMKAFLEKKSRKWSWFARGILLLDEEERQELYDKIEARYEAQANQ
ncbi:hypothetical protein [Bernardetia sp.]|uniref:hypothetical protein n=1 Tax=Bernardetia sp. TaxID=1937974 RepID=UPI0025C4BF63|nr:hypothetical protein [Bernardetia sp.]